MNKKKLKATMIHVLKFYHSHSVRHLFTYLLKQCKLWIFCICCDCSDRSLLLIL